MRGNYAHFETGPVADSHTVNLMEHKIPQRLYTSPYWFCDCGLHTTKYFLMVPSHPITLLGEESLKSTLLNSGLIQAYISIEVVLSTSTG